MVATREGMVLEEQLRVPYPDPQTAGRGRNTRSSLDF